MKLRIGLQVGDELPPPALSGSGLRVESSGIGAWRPNPRLSSQLGNTKLPGLSRHARHHSRNRQAPVSFGVSILMVAGEFDLSVGSTFAVVGFTLLPGGYGGVLGGLVGIYLVRLTSSDNFLTIVGLTIVGRGTELVHPAAAVRSHHG